jgi:3-oxoadipate enol-lactonase
MTSVMPQLPSHDNHLPIVFLHGTSGFAEDWGVVIEELSRDRQLIRPDYVAEYVGRNPSGLPSISHLAAETVANLRRAGIHRFDLIGYSLGAALAIFITAEYPEIVRSVVLVSGFDNVQDSRMRLQFELWLRLTTTDRVALTMLLLMSGLSQAFLSRFDGATIGAIARDFVSSSDWRLIEQAIVVDQGVDVRDQSKKVTKPALIITARHDLIVPPYASLKLLKHAERMELDCGHLSFLERPVELTHTIQSFYRKQFFALE